MPNPKFKISSGSAIGKRSHKTVACTSCNFAQPHTVMFTPEGSDKERKFKLYDECPRCKNKTIRVFDSKAEYTYYSELKMLENVGEIRDINFQTKYDLHAPDFETGEPIKITSYVTDFTFEEYNKDNDEWDFKIVDVKGGNDTKVVVSPEAKLKINWFEVEYGIDVTIVGR